MEIKNRKVNMKGFTLIELLAVIIILAIIALIAVPTIMTIIDNSKKSAAADSAYGVISAAELWYSNFMLDNNGTSKGATFTCGGDNVKTCKATVDSKEQTLSIKGEVPTAGTVTVGETGTVEIKDLMINGKKCNHDTNDKSKVNCNNPE